MLLYPFCIATGLTTLAAIVHHFDPPEIFEEKYLQRSIIISFFNVFAVSFLEVMTVEGHFPLLDIYQDINDYPFYWFIIGSTLYIFFTDYLLWLNHYFLHNRHLYLFVHAFHHQVNYPTAYDFAAVHPIEMLSNWVVMHFLALIFPIYQGTIFFYGGLMSIFPILEHGNGLNRFPFNKIYDPQFHNIHHYAKIINYGVGPLAPLWDHLFYTKSSLEKS